MICSIKPKLMKYAVLTLLLLCFLFDLQAVPAQVNKEKDEMQEVEISTEKTKQTIEGWGSSLCWWAGQVGNWNEPLVDSLIDLFTAPDGLNMNIFRYNIGGGDDPSHAGGHMVKGKGKRAEMEGFKASAQSPYNWEADEAQRNIMLKIKAKRSDAVFEAFSNSPPYWMTYSGCSAGNVNAADDNLRPEFYEMFCDYLLDVCIHYNEKYGIEFKTLEPFNESTSAYWNYLGSQEGCHFEPETQMEIIRILYPKLQKSGLETTISASDETNVKSFNRVVKSYMEAGDILDKIKQLNTHTYGGTNKEREIARELVKTSGKEFWQSETGPMGLPRPARGLENNLLLAQKMFDDLRIMESQAWLDWQLMEENNDVWGLVKCNFETEEYELLKNLYVRMQITRFFKQGYQLLETDNNAVLAAQSPDKKEIVVAVLNTTDSVKPVNMKFRGNQKIKRISEVFRTSETENCQKVAPVKAKDVLSYSAPKFSLTTFLIQTDN